MRQEIGSRIYSKTITTTVANQELLVVDELNSLYNFDVTLSPVIRFELSNKTATDITLKINNSSVSTISLEATYGGFDSEDDLMIRSVKVVESGSTVKFVAILP